LESQAIVWHHDVQEGHRLKLSTQSIRQLVDAGFVILRGPHSGERLRDIAVAYDDMMARASGPEFRIASTTSRLSDVLNYGPVFDDIFLHPPLHEACVHVIGEHFKLSSFLARTLRPGAPAQDLHADLTRSSEDAPLLGFIYMIDPFRKENGATRFVPSSHTWLDLPTERLADPRASYPGEVLGCGEPGSMIVFNGAIWHGHTANVTARPRRSIQGYFVRRGARSGFEFRDRLLPEARTRMGSLARTLLVLEDEPQ
jgi:hypothetical protein